jgi:hypothetical protein
MYSLNSTAKDMIRYWEYWNSWESSRDVPPPKVHLFGYSEGIVPHMETLHRVGGYSLRQIYYMGESEAIKLTAKILGISVSHSNLLRLIDSSQHEVLSDPKKYLGSNWEKVLEFWWYIDTLSDEEKKKISRRYLALDPALRDSTRDVSIVAATQELGWKFRDVAWWASYRTTYGTSIWGEVFGDATDELIANMDNKFFYTLFMEQ